ncbi:hypothetical protein [Burkholderia cenocepacia]|uniref:hypothetical protein n=1 Tax=Burkholderia cenocepacia TaxID=95486 RepID=UPI000F58E231|nr:hypothetical protein [Burkholderia cenocepacia]
MSLRKLRDLIANDSYAITFQSMAAYRSALLAASARVTAAEPAAIPAGWKLVPIRATGVMKDAGHWALPVGVGGPWTAAAVYQAMVDNAPPLQANGDDCGGAQ